MNKLYVIGIGYKPLDKKAGEIVLSSNVIILASNRLFEVFKGYEEYDAVKDRVMVINNVDETINFIRTQTTTIVLLASGDPMFFGIGRRAVMEFGKDMVEIIPDLSSIQLAFSRIKMPWDDAFFISLHGGPDPEKRRRLPYGIDDILPLLQQHNNIAILTDKENNPSAIARSIATKQAKRFGIPSIPSLPSVAGNDGIKMYVCERLGYHDERVVEGTPAEIAEMLFADPNVVIIQRLEVRSQKSEVRTSNFGLIEDEIVHSRGLITKDEVRAVTIHKLRLPQKGIFWDIGAGSGSISIEAARMYPDLKVFAIEKVEKDEEQVNHIKENMIRFCVSNIQIIKGEAPEVLKMLPFPDRVFIGGSGGRLAEIINFVAKTQAKIVVVNAVMIETLHESIQCLENNGFDVQVSEISVSRSKTIANKRHMSALNPVFVIKGGR
ncbi:MAG: precorrin-6y C5,15-methyltransferase (decarboxylating) subunit CbiE [bacterium]|nr:precorrin-6y C5,15-methyltransferase (decarboxylating) subunit CbiE [bacterium]